MNDLITKKDLIEILDDRLAKERVFNNQKFEQLDKKIEQGFKETNQKFEQFDKKTEQGFQETKQKFTDLTTMMSDGFEDLQGGIDKLEGKHDRRVTVVEDRVRVIKNVIEKDLDKKVSW